MAKLDPRSLEKGLTYHGEVQGKRQTYQVLSSDRQYFVMSMSAAKRNAGNFNLVTKDTVERVHRKFRGRQGVTARDLFQKAKNRRLLPDALAALNVLYVLEALGRGSKDGRRTTSPQLFFNIRR